MERDLSRRSNAREVDANNRVWCSSRACYVQVERCTACHLLSGLQERDGRLRVLCRSDPDDRRARLTKDPAGLRRSRHF